MYSEETKSSNLAKFLSVYDYVFVDTCSLMEDSFPTFMDTLTASREYWKDGFEVIVKGECVEELKKHSKSKDSQEARIEAKRALKILRHDKWHHRILTITKSNSNYGFADNAIFTEVSSLRIQKKVLIITQDKTLATDLRKLNQLDSQRGRFLAVYRITPDGELEENPGEVGTSSSRNYAGSRNGRSQNTSSSHAHGFLGRFNHHKEATTATPTPTAAVSETPVEENNPLTSADRRLCANLSNPNYPSDRKAADIDAQIAALEALDEASRNKLSLAYTLEELKQEKLKLGPVAAKTPHPGEFERPLPPKKLPDMKPDATPVLVNTPKVEAKPQPAPAQPKPFRKSWFEFGYSIQEALTKAGSHSSIIFRDASVPYFAAIHGPYDITSQDLDQVAKEVGVLKPGESKDVPLKGLIAHVEKTDRDWKASLEIPVKEEAKPANPAPIVPAKVEKVAVPEPIKAPLPAKPVEAKPAQKVETAPAKTSRVKKASKAETKAEKPAKAPSKRTKKVDAPMAEKKDVATSVTAQDVNTAVPAGVTLLVGVPTNEEKKGFIERRARREANPEVAVAKNPNASSQNKKPVLQAHNVTTRAPKAKAAPVSKKPTPEVNASLAEIVKEDKNLNAKINNPNYPVADKIKDLEAQLAKISPLKAADQKDLFFSSGVIKTRLAELKKTK